MIVGRGQQQRGSLTRTGRTMPSTEEERILALAIEWLPFEGPPPETIWVKFGIDAGLNRSGFLAAPMLATTPAGGSMVERNRWPRTRRD